MNKLIYSPSLTQTPRKDPTKEHPITATLKFKRGRDGKFGDSGKIALLFAPLGIPIRTVRDKIHLFVQPLNWPHRYIRIHFTITSTTCIELKLADHSPSSIIHKLDGEELKITDCSGNHLKTFHSEGNLTFQQVIEIAKNGKRSEMISSSIMSRVKQVLGTCMSIGCKIDGEDPRIILLQIRNGTFRHEIQED